jgi:hypothetical protein
LLEILLRWYSSDWLTRGVDRSVWQVAGGEEDQDQNSHGTGDSILDIEPEVRNANT